MHILLMTGMVAAATVAAPLSEPLHPEHRARCVESMKLTAEDVATGLHEYRIVRCAAESAAREQQATRIRRAEERLDRTQSEFRGRIREGKRFLSTSNQQRFDPDTAEQRTARAFSRRALLRNVENFSTEEARAQRSLLQQQRMTEAREACRNVPRSFYQNCVRETIRTLGESGDR